jgi:hypothetical protein
LGLVGGKSWICQQTEHKDCSKKSEDRHEAGFKRAPVNAM